LAPSIYGRRGTRTSAGGDKPTGALAAVVDEHFGSFDKFMGQLQAAALGVQGSGWVALV